MFMYGTVGSLMIYSAELCFTDINLVACFTYENMDTVSGLTCDCFSNFLSTFGIH